MEIFLFIKGILVKDEIFNFVFSDFNNTPNLRLKFIDDACSRSIFTMAKTTQILFTSQINQILT